MKILEVRDGFIKFETDNSVYLSSFVQISGTEKNYVAQIVQIKRSGTNSIAYAKILFLYNGALQPYDKTLPSQDSEIKRFTFNILNNSINASTPVIAGETPEEGINIIIDESAFNKKMLMSIDNKNANNLIVRNLVKQFNNIGKKVLIIDTLGVIEANKFKAGIDFKLPLNTASLAFMYEDCLNDATADSKSLIIEIFKDLSDYSQTVPFVPFEALKTIVDEMVDKSHVFKLLVLKNKLAKFDKLGYFAKDKTEVDKIDTILNSKCAIIDLSKLDSAFQNRYLSFLYEKLKGNDNTQVILELSNTVSKKNLKNVLSSESIATAFVTHSQFKYLNDIKNLFDNFIITPSFANNEIFKVYGTFLNAMKDDTYFITGEAVNYIPLVSSLKKIDEVIPAYNPQENITDNSVKTEEPPELKEEIQEEQEVSEDDEILEEITNSEQDEEIVEIKQEEVIEPEIIEENTEKVISEEEILTSIDEKSDAVITNAINTIEAPPVNMFDSDDSSDENADEEENEEVLDNNENEPVENESDDIPELENIAEPDDTDEFSEDFESEQETIGENLVEETELQDNDNISDELSMDSLAETPYEDLEPIEELPLTESIEEDVENNLTIQEYVEEDFNDTIDENALDDLALEADLSSDLENEQEFLDTDTLPENEEVEIPDGIDLEFEPQDLTEISEQEDTLPASENGTEEEINILPLSDDNSDFEEIVELNPDDTDENDIVIDIEDNEDSIPNEEEIVKDVDKVFTTRKEDDLSDSDLDFIDELNNDGDVLLEEVSDEGSDILEELAESDQDSGILEEQQELPQQEPQNDEILETRNTSTPIVPVYDADIPQEDLVMSDPIAQGDTVTHAKYGSGVVEKMIKYGNKTLFSINFDNVGRRLLDPTLTEIKKS